MKISDLKPRVEMEFKTDAIDLKERAERRDALIGVWVRIYRNGVYLADFAEPRGLVTQMDWLNFSIDAIH
ncbi:hypothetical protein [Cerasicoccus maritimus]|uniref:hypothetical protein n=1 Tax=Cerasicoccus maritimus TaxID=490089 RepID=UPI0028529CAA|nr:hypothetical protein [Cerasicoccus maritimus]